MKKDDKEQAIKFTVSEPPFHYDPRDKGAMEKLSRANQVGLGEIDDDNEVPDGLKGRSTASARKQFNFSSGEDVIVTPVNKTTTTRRVIMEAGPRTKQTQTSTKSNSARKQASSRSVKTNKKK
ncbi:MAG: hypothetical protein WCF67_06540 [Chitinophagaceae bacterium]